MSIQSLQSFRQQVNGNNALAAAVKTCLSAPGGALDLEALATLGRKNGYDFSADDVRSAMAATDDELSDLELEVVSAGATRQGTSSSPTVETVNGLRRPGLRLPESRCAGRSRASGVRT